MTNPLHSRYGRATSSCALFQLESWTDIDVSGPDSLDFLNRIGTADIRSLQPGAGLQSLFLRGDGRLVAACIVLRVDDYRYVILTPEDCAQELWDHLDRFHFSENLALARPEDRSFIGMVSGSKRGMVASYIENPTGSGTGFIAEVSVGPSAARVFAYFSRLHFDSLRAGLYQRIAELDGVIGDGDLYEIIRIEDSIPEFGKELSTRTIPLEAGLKSAISFTKGCFPGQEIVARINNLGHPANVLALVKLPQTARSLAGRKLLVQEKEVGYITSTCFSPSRDSIIGLAYVKWNLKEPGQTLSLENETGTAEILSNVYGNV